MSTLEIARRVISNEIEGLHALVAQLDQQFDSVVELILSTQGRTIICGMGKSGIIGKKIAASFASTGTPSFFMHPGEAFHGDLGMVTPADIFIAISNSGETEEVLKLLPFLKDNNNHIIAITGNPNSTLAKNAHYHLNVAVPSEACPLQLAPTSSTTATLVIGDALTVALMESRRFQPEHFARFHPGGSLGRKLLSKVADEMIKDELPVVTSETPLGEVLNVMSKGTLGLTLVVNNGELYAIITDGDLRRAIEKYGKDLFDLQAEHIASRFPATIEPEVPMSVAYDKMQNKKINSLIVCNGSEVVGVLKK
ncbi:arabinose-5-phosphate isomerase [Pseudoalteromonas peptidolytica F12-50-A1]|uniref:Arabinose 5-phosphate isomerase n=1 Tax=Pseudoalteromonas peptidolytica F12-50-A1 TaxID=1315280 RepID=A0A8I0MY60_9GAMM|nr:KpsF/GutQ family sugar-phosphate isomerase [Pseudoalteromonas peptidolytica]MBE0347320.1 arabinose-5-phosphate isomerase [Pseudoalteromonas peptidolytica F12-50-A1]NLR13953.1 KpsF/GutQ family sugar-phosphate isomerase [Pseudoalteromonas peptidolytica]GEK09915.1 arabinose 5-phosphate isomerase [Pseudoalteromonas peptidolytica]